MREAKKRNFISLFRYRFSSKPRRYGFREEFQLEIGERSKSMELIKIYEQTRDYLGFGRNWRHPTITRRGRQPRKMKTNVDSPVSHSNASIEDRNFHYFENRRESKKKGKLLAKLFSPLKNNSWKLNPSNCSPLLSKSISFEWNREREREWKEKRCVDKQQSHLSNFFLSVFFYIYQRFDR